MLANADSIHRLIATLGSRNSDSTLVVSSGRRVAARSPYAQRLRNWDSPSYSTWILKLRELENEMPLGGPLPRRLNLHRVPAIWPFGNASQVSRYPSGSIHHLVGLSRPFRSRRTRLPS